MSMFKYPVFFPDRVKFHVLHMYMDISTCAGTCTSVHVQVRVHQYMYRYVHISTCTGTCTSVDVQVHVHHISTCTGTCTSAEHENLPNQEKKH
jgi:hypothetical protein